MFRNSFSKLKYLIVAGVLLVGLLVTFGGCSLSFPFVWWDEDEIEQAPFVSPTVIYGNGEALPDFSEAMAAVGPSVVRIVVTETVQQHPFWWLQPIPKQEVGVGTGVVIGTEGQILTNKHVVEGVDSVSDIEIHIGGETIKPKHVWWSNVTDLALLETQRSDLAVAQFPASDEEIGVGQWVIAIGYPFNIGGAPTVTQGIISAEERSIKLDDGTTLEDMVQTTAAINPGNSGGPLVNLAGEIVGINTAVLSDAENIGFAISKDTVLEFLQVES